MYYWLGRSYEQLCCILVGIGILKTKSLYSLLVALVLSKTLQYGGS